MGFVDRLSRALMNAQAGGFLAHPPDWAGEGNLGIPGFSGLARPQLWDAVASATVPDLPVDHVHFVALPDGTLIVDEVVPDGSLSPLADAIEQDMQPPYRAEAVRHESDAWGVGARHIEIAELPASTHGDRLELTSVGGETHLTVDGEPTATAMPELLELGRRRGQDFVLLADRLDETTWAVDLCPL